MESTSCYMLEKHCSTAVVLLQYYSSATSVVAGDSTLQYYCSSAAVPAVPSRGPWLHGEQGAAVWSRLRTRAEPKLSRRM